MRPLAFVNGASMSCPAKAGTPIGADDLWIGCYALSRNATLVAHNVREFERIAGLKLEDWVI